MLKVLPALCATLVFVAACSPEAQVPEADVTLTATAQPADTATAQASSDAATSASASQTPPGAASSTAVDTTSKSGGSVANAGAVVAGMAKDFRRCYQLALKDDPNAKGSVRISAKIGPKGEVVSATPTEAKGLPQPVVQCVADVVRTRTFDAPEGGGATIVIPISFAGEPPPCDPKSDPLCTPP